MAMWKDATTVKSLSQLSKHRRILMDRILSRFNVPSTGVVFVLEKEDYQDYPNST
jgi:hypothetical protein